jgi:hypothetical protein
MGELEVRWDQRGLLWAGDYNFFMEEEKKHQMGTRYFVHHRMSAIKKVEFVIRMIYIVLRGRWYNIILMNAHATTVEESDDLKDTNTKN